MSQELSYRRAAAELIAYIVAYLASVPLIGFTSLAWLAHVSGSPFVAMALAPLLLWCLTWTYGIAFEGALQLAEAFVLYGASVRNGDTTSRKIYRTDLVQGVLDDRYVPTGAHGKLCHASIPRGTRSSR